MSAATTGGADSALPTGLELTALDPRFREDPYPVLAELRTRAPVHHDRVLQQFVLTRHDDVHDVLHDLSLWSDPRKAREGTAMRSLLGDADGEPSMLLMDDPGHKRLRDLVRRSFTPRAIERWRPRVRAVAERLVSSLPGSFDLVESLAAPLPSMAIAELLGIDPGKHADFKAWSDLSVAVGFNPAPEPEQLAAADEARTKLYEFFSEEIAQRERASGRT